MAIVWTSVFAVHRSRFTVQGSGFNVPGSEFRVPSSGFRVPGSGFRVNKNLIWERRHAIPTFLFLLRPCVLRVFAFGGSVWRMFYMNSGLCYCVDNQLQPDVSRLFPYP